MRRVLQVVDQLPEEASESVAAAGGTTVLAERALTGVIAALQTLAKEIHYQAGKSVPSGNPWQNVDRLQRRWLDDFQCDLFDGLEPTELQTLRLAFARRHVLGQVRGLHLRQWPRRTIAAWGAPIHGHADVPVTYGGHPLASSEDWSIGIQSVSAAATFNCLDRIAPRIA
jgi:hypothetical protein